MLKLRRTAAIRGVVVEASGAPAAAVVAAETDDGPVVTAPTGDDGSFVLAVPEDEPGPFRVAARRSHDQPVGGEVADVAPGTSGLRIVLAPPKK